MALPTSLIAVDGSDHAGRADYLAAQCDADLTRRVRSA